MIKNIYLIIWIFNCILLMRNKMTPEIGIFNIVAFGIGMIILQLLDIRDNTKVVNKDE